MLQTHRSPAHRTSLGAAAIIGAAGAVIAVAMRWYFVTHAQVFQPLDSAGETVDAIEYYRYAWNLVHHHVFSQAAAGVPIPTADSYRDPGYPLFLAFFMCLTHSYDGWYASVLLAQAFLGGLSVACMTLAARDTLPRWALAVVALTMALWPHCVSITAYALSENLTAPLWALAVLTLRTAITRHSASFTVAAGLALAAASLTNAALSPLVVPLALALSWKKQMRPRLLFILLVVAIAPVAAWNMRNALVATGQSSSFRAQINLVQGSWPTYHLATQLDAHHVAEGTQTVEAINSEIWAMRADPMTGFRMMGARMGGRPGTYLAWYLSKPALLWGWQIGLGAGDIYVYPTRDSPFLTHPGWRIMEGIAFGLNQVIAALALAGLMLTLWRRATDAALVAIAVTLAWITLIYGILQSDPRYAIPFRAGEFVLAAAAILGAIEWLKERARISDAAHETH
ncbi:4-amino-4-deoxy-L-arabinose transferase-like glycosyltransferase [Luteibacter sp. 621]|uniref:hypothetical protein n=1 Tax=Luteibacter sp. 621 TaxID=3373916 RepID=UPI003D1B70C1